jgi:hypothetical protein
MKHLILIAAFLCVAPVAHAKPLPAYDMDELLFCSDAVVEGSIVRASTHEYQRLAQVKVERVLAGDALSGGLSLDVSLYAKKELGNEGTYGELQKRRVKGKTVMVFVPFAHQPPQISRELSAGDRAIFFLRNRVKHPFDFEKASGLVILDSGVRLLRSGRVGGFTQMSNPGGYVEQPGVPRAVFDAGLAASRARVADLKAHLTRPARLEDATYFERWNTRGRAKMVGVWFSSSALSTAINERLAQIHKLKRSQTR